MSEAQLPVKAMLGDGEVFVKETAEGTLKAVKGQVTLSLVNKEIVSIPGGGVMITSYGYDSLNRIAGLTIIKPPRIGITERRRDILETFEVENPYVEYNEDGSVRVVTVEYYAVGLSAIGNWCITQERLRYDLHQYFVAEAWSKVRRYQNSGKFVQKSVGADENHMWIQVMGDWGVSLDVQHEEIVKILQSHITRQKFAERIASTICRRNAMKRHPAIGKSEVIAQGGSASVTVYGWQHDLSAKQINKMAQIAAGGNVPSTVEVLAEETAVEFGKSEIEAVESEVLTDNMEPHVEGQGGSSGQQGLSDKEEGLDKRSRQLLFLGAKERELGHDKFVEVVGFIVTKVETQDVSTFSDDDLCLSVECIYKWEKDNGTLGKTFPKDLR